MSDLQIQQFREVGRIAPVLAFAAGFVDAVGYIVLFQIFTAHMSGNTVAMCVQFSRHDWAELIRRGFPIPMFLLGTSLGAFLNQGLPRLGLKRTFSIVFALEATLLVLFVWLGQSLRFSDNQPFEYTVRYYVLLALLPLAMGLQNATVRRIGVGTVHTTYISGLLTSLTEEIIKLLFRCYDRNRNLAPSEVAVTDPLSVRRIALMSCVYLAYLTGAVLGGFAQLAFALSALLIPVCCLAGVILYDLRHPLMERSS